MVASLAAKTSHGGCNYHGDQQQVLLQPRAWLSFVILILEVNVTWHRNQQLTGIAYYSLCAPGDRWLDISVLASAPSEK